MPTVLDDTPGTLTEGDAPGKAPDGAGSEPEAAATEQRHCANCGAPLEEGQDWCLHCGTATPGALDDGRPRWRSLGIVLGVVAALVAGAATAAYAALNEGPAKHVHLVVAQTQAPPASGAPATLLDTNAASTYTPSGYPASWFGDPSLTIDGDPSTAWSAQVNPATAPRMAVGVAIDLRSAHRLSALELITSTPGMTVQIYGANTSSLPSSISSSAWVALSGPTTVNNRHTQITLGKSTTSFRFVTLWISKAPAGSVGTAQAPGRVDVNEIELFPAR